MTDYSKFKTPFFKISIGDSSGKNMRELPEHVMSLVEKVEITETLCCNSFDQITINFIEGSREPYKVSEGFFADPENYDPSYVDLLSNRSGMLTDLRITSNGLSTAAPGSTTIIEQAGITPPSSTEGKDNTPPETIIVPTEKVEPEDADVHYLLHQRNQVQVTWGYLEDELSIRKTTAYILIVTTDFPENGSPRTTVICHSSAAMADQMTTTVGKVFGKKIKAGLSESGKDLYDWVDNPPAELIKALSKDADIDFIVSPEFRAPVYEEGKAKHWLGGQSLHQFLLQLAIKHDAVYDIVVNVNTGKDTIIFLNKDEYERYPIIQDDVLLTYKANGSILKSISVRADFGVPVGSFVKGISEEGGKVEAAAPAPVSTLFDGSRIQNNYPDTTNPSRIAIAANKASAAGTAASSIVGVEASSPGNLKEGARTIAGKMGTAMVSLDFTSLGFTQITTGSAKFSGIGERYNGYYKVQTVSHTLDSQGYSCKGTAIAYTNGTGGVTVADPTTVKAAPPKESKLFEAVNTTIPKSSPEIEKAREVRGIKTAIKTNG